MQIKRLADCIRVLSADAVEEAQSGHPGMPLGFADVMTILAFEFLCFNPNDSRWSIRDRLILSAGHGSMLLYSFFYLTGYKNFNLDDIKKFRKLNSKTPGHPEYSAFQAIETTTGPLGQGIANAVGMAIAQKKYQIKFGREYNYKIYVIVGDGCLMEGISYEALSLAGHLKLDNLIVLFDDNKISIDGSTKLSTSEDHLKRFESVGFDVFASNGHNYNEIRDALSNAQNSSKPSFTSFRTIIGKGINLKLGSEKSHGSPLGKSEILFLKENIGFKRERFHIDKELREIWRGCWLKNKDKYDSWQQKNHLDNLKFSILKDDLKLSCANEATRKSSSRIIELITNLNEKIICGSCDLSISTGLLNSTYKAINASDFSGNFIHYGIREHAMSGIMNGLALSGFIPIGGTFLVFSDYMRPAIRLSALMKLHVIYVMTHDSIGVGEDGPTHQPVEQLASLRAIPNLKLFRPADAIETQECYEMIFRKKYTALIALSRQKITQLRQFEKKNLSESGGYIISDSCNTSLDVTIFATGSEVSISLKVQDILEKNNIATRICSVPCMEILFESDSQGYLSSLCGNAKTLVAIEAGCRSGWDSIIGKDGLFFGVESFGLSASGEDIYNHIGITPKKIAEKIMKEIK